MGRGGRGVLTPDEELRALLLLRLLPGVGDRTVHRLVEEAGSATTALDLPRRAFAAIAGEKAAAQRRTRELATRVAGILRRSEELGLTLLPWHAPRYPDPLRHLADPPPILFLRGDTALLDRPMVTVVGSRRATAAGRRTARRFARAWSEAGVVVVSGMALGIDGTAHRGALEGGGGTVAVLGSGPDCPYPAANRGLFRRILEAGLVVTEFPPGEKARPHHFPRRNRILAGLSSAVVVVEAARRSGALITVDHALDLGKEVFAVPGSIESGQSAGANALLRDGAHLLDGPGTLLRTLGWEAPGEEALEQRSLFDAEAPVAGGAVAGGVVTGDVVAGGAPAGRAGLLSILKLRPIPLEGLTRETGLALPTLLPLLTELELEGRVAKAPEGWFLPQPGRES